MIINNLELIPFFVYTLHFVGTYITPVFSDGVILFRTIWRNNKGRYKTG